MRKCRVCGKKIDSGFVLDDGTYYYCSEECLYKEVSKEDYDEMYKHGEAYWTEWDD